MANTHPQRPTTVAKSWAHTKAHLQLSRLMGMPAYILAAALLGVGCAVCQVPGQIELARFLVAAFGNVMGLVSLPVIFLALFTTLCGASQPQELKWLSRKVVGYTLLTTVLAAGIALGLYLLIQPARVVVEAAVPSGPQGNYFDHLLAVIPANIFSPFMERNVIGVLLMAVGLGAAMAQVPGRGIVHDVSQGLLQGFMRVVRSVVWAIPVVVWAGVVLSYQDLAAGGAAQLWRYLCCVVAANVLQAAVVLPLILKARGLRPWACFKGMTPALSLAFFSKSSVATIPVAMQCAESTLGVRAKVARFVFPVCTTINMNACAAFILITVLFVAQSHGMVFAPWELGLWVGIATLAAVGNAGVPMGCYFLASAFVTALGLPATKLVLILPFYSLLDMLETAVNVWSDGCVAVLVNQDCEAVENAQGAALRRAA